MDISGGMLGRILGRQAFEQSGFSLASQDIWGFHGCRRYQDDHIVRIYAMGGSNSRGSHYGEFTQRLAHSIGLSYHGELTPQCFHTEGINAIGVSHRVGFTPLGFRLDQHKDFIPNGFHTEWIRNEGFAPPGSTSKDSHRKYPRHNSFTQLSLH
jgi:hypothetical protein